MNLIKIDDLVIGEGAPKIIIPLVGTTREEIFEEAKSLNNVACDLVEWRIDFFKEVKNVATTAAFSHELKEILQKPLLITFRSHHEGGVLTLPDADYFALYHDILKNGAADLLDIELFMPETDVDQLISAAHAKGVKIILSNHDFEATPSKDEMINRLCQMQEKGADICKIAVMPRSAKDVLTLLSATEEMHRKYAKCPLITMSMADKGMVSRISGELFGSVATFGIAKKASAPGQIPANDLKEILKILTLN